MSKVTFLTCEGGDWQALYIDGQLVDQNHSIGEVRLLEYLEENFILDLERLEVTDEYAEGQGWMPEKRSEIPDSALVE